MIRKTTLRGSGKSGEVKIVIQSISVDGELMKSELGTHHDELTESVFKAMGENGCYLQKIQVSK